MKKIFKEILPFNNTYSDNTILYILKTLLKIFLIYVISLVVAEGIVIALHYPFGYDPFGKPFPFDVMLLFKYYGYIIFILFYLFFIKKLEKIKLSEVGLNKDIKKILKGIILGIISLSIIILILMLFNQIKFNGINKDVNYLIIILFLGGYLIQASMEEIICRGFILNKIKNKTNIYLAIIISFLFFSVGHFGELFNDGVVIGFIGVINLFLVSLIWSNLSIKDNNIYSAIGFHFIWNFTLFNIIGLNLSGVDANYSLLKFTSNNSFLSGMSYGIESSIITTLILILTILLVECVKRTKK